MAFLAFDSMLVYALLVGLVAVAMGEIRSWRRMTIEGPNPTDTEALTVRQDRHGPYLS